jgi:outer membrane lipoprotein SlyB
MYTIVEFAIVICQEEGFPMKRVFVFAAILTALVLASCAKNDSGTPGEQAGQHATVTLKDGTVSEGNVVASSSKEITIAGDDKITRTIPMDQVRSIEYNDVAAAKAPEPPKATEETAPVSEKPPVSSVKSSGLMERAAPAAPVEKAAPPLELASGTQISIRTEAAIDSATAGEGQTFPAEVTKDVKDEAGIVVIPARSSAEVIIKSVSAGGHVRGASDLVLDLKSINIGGRRYSLETTDVSKVGKAGVGANKRTATYTGGGAAVGAIIGAIAGGGKGAALGAVSGAGAGALTQILTKGKSIRIPAETILTFQLEKPLRVSASAQ